MLTHKSLNLNSISMFVLVFGIAISASFINTAQGSEQKKHDHSEVFIWEWNLELEKINFEAEEIIEYPDNECTETFVWECDLEVEKVNFEAEVTIEYLNSDHLEAFIWEWEHEGLS